MRRWVKAVVKCHQAAGLCTPMAITFAIFRPVTAQRELRFGCRREALRLVRNMIRRRTSLYLETPQDNDSSSQAGPSKRLNCGLSAACRLIVLRQAPKHLGKPQHLTQISPSLRHVLSIVNSELLKHRIVDKAHDSFIKFEQTDS